ncbi:MAG TPA: PP2C family protein-serine/threonine phosphatase [Victivallales bacterium]|nr:PP2C family protein-serine/threonine phosphatase [Victivallales bacterium]
MIITLLSIIALFIILSFLYYFMMIKKPVNIINKAIKSVNKGNFDVRLQNLTGTKSISNLADEINSMVKLINSLDDKLKVGSKIAKVIEPQLKIAAKLQKSLLPKITDKYINNQFQLYINLIPSIVMSGDFYDFFYLNSKTLALIIADVSGKGMPGAFYMSIAKILIKDECLGIDEYSAHDPAKIMNKVNKVIYRNNPEMMFLTMYLVFYDIETGKVTYSNAGHHEFILLENNGSIKTDGFTKKAAIGLFEDTEYISKETQLMQNQTIIFYTDGIVEAPDSNKNAYGTDRLKNIFQKNSLKELNDLGDTVIQDVLNYQNNVKFDDITLLMLKRINKT